MRPVAVRMVLVYLLTRDRWYLIPVLVLWYLLNIR